MGKAITRTPLIAQQVPEIKDTQSNLDYLLYIPFEILFNIFFYTRMTLTLIYRKFFNYHVMLYAPISFPRPVVGYISPYPTVVMVIMAHQKDAGMLWYAVPSSSFSAK